MKKNSISIIIPVVNEAESIDKYLPDILLKADNPLVKEIIVVDGNSTDHTLKKLTQYDVTVISSPKRGRAYQMNYAAKHAKGSILYFVHLDTILPNDFAQIIIENYLKGYKSGCFRLKFDLNHYYLNFWAWFTRFNFNICRGGDQTLYVDKQLFMKINGFNETNLIGEDMAIIPKLRKQTKFIVLPKRVITSARKYQTNGIFRLQFLFSVIHFMLIFGVRQQTILQFYKKHIR